MSVDSTHPEYDAHLASWMMARDFAAGEEVVKAKGTDYLPMLGGQADDRDGHKRYAAYKMRAAFYNATGRTVDGLTGMVFRKPPIVSLPAAMEDFRNDVSLGDHDLQGFAESVVEEVMTPGRCGILVDFPRVESGGLTREQAARMNLRPFLSMYRAEDIWNWRVGQLGNRTVITQVRLHEIAEDQVDEFTTEQVDQLRVLDLDEAGAYRQRIFRKNAKKKWEQFGDDIYPLMNGQKMDYVPFIFVGPRDTQPHVCKPPLLDLAQVNASHYRTSADIEHGAHFTALPTPWRTGITEQDRVSDEIGPEAIWEMQSSEAKVGLLEYTGAGLESLEKRLDRKENQMASLGARMLAPDKRMAEAAETAMIHRQGEISVLASLAHAVSTALTKAIEIARDWMGITEDVSIQLNTDFLPNKADPQLMATLLKAVQAGEMSSQEFFEALQQAELVRSDKSYEEHQSEVGENAPALGVM